MDTPAPSAQAGRIPADRDRSPANWHAELSRGLSRAHHAVRNGGAAVAVKDSGEFRVAAADGLLEPHVGRPFPVPADSAHRAVDTGCAVKVRSVELTESSNGGADRPPALRAVVAPIELPGGGSGVLQVVRPEDDTPFRAADARALEVVAGELSARLERFELMRRLAETDTRRARAESAQIQFLEVVSHELRTPLNAIVCYSELLDDAILGELNDRQREAIERLRLAGRRLSVLIDDMLDLSNLDLADTRLVVERTELRSLADAIASTLRPDAERRGLEFRVDGAGSDVVVGTDPHKVQRILLNLCTDVINFARTGIVRVTVQHTPDGARVEVRCDAATDERTAAALPAGPGAEVEPASQPDAADARFQPGLALAIRLAALLGGDVAPVERPGSGYRLVLPSRAPVSTTKT